MLWVGIIIVVILLFIVFLLFFSKNSTMNSAGTKEDLGSSSSNNIDECPKCVKCSECPSLTTCPPSSTSSNLPNTPNVQTPYINVKLNTTYGGSPKIKCSVSSDDYTPLNGTTYVSETNVAKLSCNVKPESSGLDSVCTTSFIPNGEPKYFTLSMKNTEPLLLDPLRKSYGYVDCTLTNTT